MDEQLWEKAYNKKKVAVIHEFKQFLLQIKPEMSLLTVGPEDLVRFLVWKDRTGKTQIHKVSCQFLGNKSIQSCGCPIRMASGTVSNVIAHLRSFFMMLGRGTTWSAQQSYGNPASAPQVREYLLSIKDEQAMAHIVPHQAQPLFLEKLIHLCKFWANELAGYLSRAQRFVILRDRAFFTLQFFAGDRANDLSFLAGQSIKVLPEGSGLYLQLTYGKQWKGDYHNDFIVTSQKDQLVCPVTALRNYVDWARFLGADLSKGYVFRLVSRSGEITAQRMNYDVAYKQLKMYLRVLGIDNGETPHGIRAGSSISLLASGASQEDIMAHIGWRSPATYSHYTRQTVSQSKQAMDMLSSYVEEKKQPGSSGQVYYDGSSFKSFFP